MIHMKCQALYSLKKNNNSKTKNKNKTKQNKNNEKLASRQWYAMPRLVFTEEQKLKENENVFSSCDKRFKG